jgi:hypothetical protein
LAAALGAAAAVRGEATETAAPTAPPREVLMPGSLGAYPVTRDASGTSWLPDSAEMAGLHAMTGAWMTMLHGSLTGVYTQQGGPRGDHDFFNESYLMLAAARASGTDTFALKTMLSLEPLDGARGYPLLFQTGETANGRDPLIDRQHPHNLVMEAAGSYSRAVSESISVFLYGGPVGEPALGPPVFIHRFASMVNPDAPLTHHWLDATHVAFGVVTAGVVAGRWKFDASYFNGREPDEHRYSVQLRPFDSTAVRLSFNPTSHWAVQVSTGRLASPEQLQPQTSVRRTTASVLYDRAFGDAHWQSILAFGRDAPSIGRTTDGYLLDSAIELGSRQIVFGRLEHVVKDDLVPTGQPLAGQPFLIENASLGYVYTLATRGHIRYGVGALYSIHRIPTALQASYGQDPTGYSVFLRASIVP